MPCLVVLILIIVWCICVTWLLVCLRSVVLEIVWVIRTVVLIVITLVVIVLSWIIRRVGVGIALSLGKVVLWSWLPFIIPVWEILVTKIGLVVLGKGVCLIVVIPIVSIWLIVVLSVVVVRLIVAGSTVVIWFAGIGKVVLSLISLICL